MKLWVALSVCVLGITFGNGRTEAATTAELKKAYQQDSRRNQMTFEDYLGFNTGLEKSARIVPRAVATTNQRQAIVNEALKHLGKAYTQDPKKRMGPTAFDCSGLAYYVFQQVTGKNIGTWTVPQEKSGTRIAVNGAQPGDLYFWGDQGSTYHVAIAIGNNQYVHSPTFNEQVKVERINPYFAPSFALRMNLTGPSSVNLADYHTVNPGKIATKKSDSLYSSVEFNGSTKKKQLPKDSLLTVQSIAYAANGTPRFKTSEGYYSAAKADVIKVVGNIDPFYTINPGQIGVLKDNYYYSSIEFSNGTRGQKVISGSLVTVLGVEYSSGGLPRLKTSKGYLTAAKSEVVKPISNLTSYLSVNPLKVVTLTDDTFYTSVEFNASTRKTKIKAGTVLTVQKIEFNGAGVPRLKTSSGYYTAAKASVLKTISQIDQYLTVNPLKVVTLTDDALYTSVDFTTKTKKRLLKKGTVLAVQKIDYTANGTPRLKTKEGYFTAAKTSVKQIK